MDKKVAEFPDVDKKLQAPTKQSVFERQKQEAEAKRLRDEAETAAVYQDFVKSFDDDDSPPPRSGFNSSGFGAVTGPPKRHFGGPSVPGPGRIGFAGRGATSGPGSLGPPPNSLGRKRPLEGFQAEVPRRRDWEDGRLDNEFSRSSSKRPAFNNSDDEEERQGGRSAEPQVPKPTLRLANLPPGTSPAVIKALIPQNLTVDAVRITPSAAPIAVGERRSMSAIVTLSKETPANDIEATVNSLQNRYLGYGFYLSLHRHLSSAALSGSANMSVSSGASAQPFGAKPVHIDHGPSQAHAPPGQRGFAPPSSYAPSGPGQLSRNQPLLHVPVAPPRALKELKLIHKTIESMLTHGPEFEALLMSRSEVQRDEKWAWLWDSRSTGGVWYRWRLWEVLTGSQTRKGQGRYLPLFEDSSAWKAPDAPLAYEYTTHLDEFVSDSEYNSSDDDESGDEGGRRRPTNKGGPPDVSNLNNDEGVSFLNPLEKAKLTHLLARLPTSTGQLLKGEVSRITAFAISHAGRGADEVVAAIISNIERPYSYTSANPNYKKQGGKGSGEVETSAANDEEDEDTSSAKLIALFVVSDLLSSSSTSGVRHAWRYRQLFESGLKNRHVFEGLGRMEKKLSWGRLRAEKWKRSVNNVLSLWEGWCVFPQDSQDYFAKVFNDPPLLKAEEEEKRLADVAKENKKSKWKSVEGGVDSSGSTPMSLPASTRMDDGDRMQVDEEDLDGEAMMDGDDDDLDGVPMEDEDEVEDENDGDAMVEDGAAENETSKPMSIALEPKSQAPPSSSSSAAGVLAPRPPHRRPKAVDMFADSASD